MNKILYVIIAIILIISAWQLIPPENYTASGEKKFGSYDVENGDFQEFEETDFTEDKKEGIEGIRHYIDDALPDEYMEMVYSLEVMTDGDEGNDAYVYMDTHHSNEWVICIDYANAYDDNGAFSEDFDETVSHEAMHIITLNETQIDNDSKRDTYVVDEGKLKEDSYLNVFYNKFWKDSMDVHKEFMDLGEDLGTVAYFTEYPDTFITDYAATNPEEDIAESFAYFVSWDKPTGDKLYEQKILFFYDYPELVEIRKLMLITTNNNIQ